MPAAAPGSLSDAEYLQLLQYMFDVASVVIPSEALTYASLDNLILRSRAAPEKGEEVSWRTIHGELNANRYSPLDQINADNAQDLEIAWRWKAGNFGPSPEIRSVTMPIMHEGRLYPRCRHHPQHRFTGCRDRPDTVDVAPGRRRTL